MKRDIQWVCQFDHGEEYNRDVHVEINVWDLFL